MKNCHFVVYISSVRNIFFICIECTDRSKQPSEASCRHIAMWRNVVNRLIIIRGQKIEHSELSFFRKDEIRRFSTFIFATSNYASEYDKWTLTRNRRIIACILWRFFFFFFNRIWIFVCFIVVNKAYISWNLTLCQARRIDLRRTNRFAL